MIKRLFLQLGLSLFGLFIATIITNQPTHAYSNGRLMDDVIFDRVNSMTEQQIRDFINSRPSSCLATSGAIFPEPITYWEYGGNVDAARVIYNSAIYNDLNPQVILATLQKEQSLITRTNCYEQSGIDSRNKAMGMGCPDGGACPAPAYAGFHQQVMKGSWTLKFAKERANGNVEWGGNGSIGYSGPWTEGYRKGCSTCSNIYRDGYWTVDGQTFKMETGATASFYRYTPHLGQSLPSIFEGWFGPATTNGYAFVGATNPPAAILPDQVVNVSIIVQNTSSLTWYADGSVPSGGSATRLMTLNYASTPYANSADPAWLGTRSQVKMATSSVAPGQNATFTFTFKGPRAAISSYVTRFNVVLDGVLVYKDIGMAFTTSTPAPSWTYSFVSATNPPTTILPNQVVDATITVKNTGNMTWYADGNTPSGERPIRLILLGYQPTPYAAPAIDPAWLGTRSQVKMATSSVAPGQNATFTFKFVGPMAATQYISRFTLVLDGLNLLPNIGMAFGNNTPTPNYSYAFVSAVNPPAIMSVSGAAANTQLTLRNTGNVVWYNETTNSSLPSIRLAMVRPWYRNSGFYNAADAKWLTASQIGADNPITNPGQDVTFTFTWKPPAQAGTYEEYFAPVLDGAQIMKDIGMMFTVSVQ